MPNRLARADSAYLRQHGDNPVDWFEWGEEAFEVARSTNRPIFLSVGYAACHWCHVMAHESFENEEIAQLLNRDFVSIKVDREERPDVDLIYMAATQVVSGHGGWPMSVFLTPQGRAFMAGTYFPPTDRHGQPSFARLLAAMSDAWNNQRDAVEEQAEEIAAATIREVRFIDRLSVNPETISYRELDRDLVDHLVERVDDDGGFGGAPKFPRPSYVEALLRHWDLPAARHAATVTLNAMSRRGMYDHLRGGFARYSVDAEWHVPHFEKMLSDQALLALAYLRADRVAGGVTEWHDVAIDTLRFVVNDLAVPDGFASSLDADSGGSEGAHVTWTASEVTSALRIASQSKVVPDVLQRWRIEEKGEFEGRSIPRLAEGQPFKTPTHLVDARETLRRVRAQRVQPGRDEKVVLEWNAMFASAALESRDDELIGIAKSLIRRLATTHFDQGHWWRTSSRKVHATASDIAWLIDARISAFELDGDDEWLSAVPGLISYLLDHYWDGEVPTTARPDVGSGIFMTADVVNDLTERPKEIFDGATPSSHATVTAAIARYSLITSNDDLAAVANRLITLAASVLAQHPAAVPDLVRALGFVQDGREIVVPGLPNQLSDLVRSCFVPSSVLITGSGAAALLRGRSAGHAYVCHNRACDLPVTTVEALQMQLQPDPQAT